MSTWLTIVIGEFVHFARSPFKIFSLLLFFGAALYGISNGYGLYKKQNNQIAEIREKEAATVEKVLGWFEEGKTGPEDKPWIDISVPFWALRNTPSTVVKTPTGLMPFTIGQSEQFGYYKEVALWSSTFDSDLAEEIANPERLAAGTLDFGFVILYLLPVLLIVLLYNIGGLETEQGFEGLIIINTTSYPKWLMARFLFYMLLVITVLLGLMIPTVILTDVFSGGIMVFLRLLLYIAVYLLLWSGLFYLINLRRKGSSNQALKMISIWLLLCVIMPGSVHQLASIKYPVNYMMDYINADRDESYEIWELPPDSIRERLMSSFPMLASTLHGKDTVPDYDIVGYSVSGLVKVLMENATSELEEIQEEKNRFIRRAYLANPVGFFRNRIDGLAGTDYYAYREFRAEIQSVINQRIEILLTETWNRETVDSQKYMNYVRLFKNQ